MRLRVLLELARSSWCVYFSDLQAAVLLLILFFTRMDERMSERICQFLVKMVKKDDCDFDKRCWRIQRNCSPEFTLASMWLALYR